MTEDEVLAFASSSFRIESAKMHLYNRNDNSFIISGAGIIDFSQDGDLQVTLLSNNYNNELVMNNFNSRVAGKIIGDEFLFDLKMNDVDNNYWKSERVLPTGRKIFDFSGNAFKSKLYSIDKISNRKLDYNLFEFYFSSKYKIPVNSIENYPNRGFSLNHCAFSYENVEIKIKDNEKYYSVSIYDKDASMSCDDALLVLEAISLATGSILHPFVGEFYCNDQWIQRVYERKEVLICPPALKTHKEADNWSLDDFILAYLSFTHEKNSRLYTIWGAIHKAYKADFFIFASLICIGIEGLLKTYLEMYGLPEDSHIREINETKDQFQNEAWLTKKMRDILFNSLNNGCNFKTKTALYSLRDLGIVTRQEISSWIIIRNQLVHAENIGSDEQLQTALDRTYICLGLFYKIVFIIIGYNGMCVNYENLSQNAGYFHNPFIEKNNDDVETLLEPMLQSRFYCRY